MSKETWSELVDELLVDLNKICKEIVKHNKRELCIVNGYLECDLNDIGLKLYYMRKREVEEIDDDIKDKLEYLESRMLPTKEMLEHITHHVL